MSNLAKFDNTLQDFNLEVNKLKEVSVAYQKLNALSVVYDNVTKQFNENSNELKEIGTLLKQGRDNIDQGIVKLLADAKKNQSEMGRVIEEKLEILRKDNKSFYKDLESTIKIKLDDNKSQIRQMIEGERKWIKDIFELEFAKNTQELKKTIIQENKEQTALLVKNEIAIKYSIWVIGTAILLLILASTFHLLH
jgi:ABC-type transporter Mla subunit MlaD